MSTEPAALHGPLVLSRELAEDELLLSSQMRTLPVLQRREAHDVRSVLNAMQLSVELLASRLMDAEAESPPGGLAAWQRHVDVLREELVRLNGKLKGLLDPAAPLAAARERFDLRAPVRELAAVLHGALSRQRIALTLVLPETAVFVHGAPARVKQAALNLLMHAANAMPEGGALVLQVDAAEGRCRLAIEHAGAALDADALGRVNRLEPEAHDASRQLPLCAASLVAESHGGALVIEAGERAGMSERLVLSLAVAP